MEYNIDWVFPKLRKPYRVCWNIASSITVVAVGIFSKLFLEWLNTTKVYNREVISRALDKRPKNIPLITVSNHHSCFDDPGIWASLEWRHLLNRRKMRWSLTAHDICFTNTFHSYFFMLGKCVPVIRGCGVYQDAINFCIEKLNEGEWVHVFPEGRVNMTKEFIRLKWGVGRMVYESPNVPLIIPMWHEGADTVLPNEPPYYLRVGKRVTLVYGEPLDLSTLVKELKQKNASEIEARKAITDAIQSELMKLKEKNRKNAFKVLTYVFLSL